MSEIYSILADIQANLKAPKGQYNSFGKYKYRNLEDIQEALKPLLAKHGAAVVIGDELVMIGDRYYVRATATLHHAGQSISASALAREAADKKGMDDSQITGATSSYARKYAMNGLFAIDDTQDADATNEHGKSAPPAQETKQPVRKAGTKAAAKPELSGEKINAEQAQELNGLIAESGIAEQPERLAAFGKRYLGGSCDVGQMPVEMFPEAITALNRVIMQKESAS